MARPGKSDGQPKLVGVDYRTIKLGIEGGTITTIQLRPRRMSPRRSAARVRNQRLRFRQRPRAPLRSGLLKAGVRSRLCRHSE